MSNSTKSKSGFTIIEVVLVLAIAGLIFLIVFLAVPALQRSQRDTQRKSDISRFMAQINAYQSNTRGNVPAQNAVGAFVTSYLTSNGDQFADPQSDSYTIAQGAGTIPAVGTIRYATSARCATDGSITGGGTPRQVAASVGLETGGAYCQQN